MVFRSKLAFPEIGSKLKAPSNYKKNQILINLERATTRQIPNKSN